MHHIVSLSPVTVIIQQESKLLPILPMRSARLCTTQVHIWMQLAFYYCHVTVITWQ
uniref:Uncharacterized protein n=1 Tax=Arundo donax TaxID=35708 RepID=A0A0A9HH89_ARUDO